MFKNIEIEYTIEVESRRNFEGEVMEIRIEKVEVTRQEWMRARVRIGEFDEGKRESKV